VDLREAEWSSYLVDRAEPRTRDGRRPSAAHVSAAGRVVTVWPVKLVLAPRAAREAVVHAEPSGAASAGWPAGWPVPAVAARPWHEAAWSRLP
jgi:hypothetical protein